MQTISHYIRPVGGAQAQPLRPDAAVFAPSEPVPMGLDGNLAVHVRPDGLTDADPAELDGLQIETWRFVMAADWNPCTGPSWLATDVAHVARSGVWTVPLAGSRTCESVVALGKLPSVPIGFELAGIAPGGSWAAPAFLLQWQGTLANRRDSGATPTPLPDDPLAGNALDVIRTALADVSGDMPNTAGETAARLAAVITALKNLHHTYA